MAQGFAPTRVRFRLAVLLAAIVVLAAVAAFIGRGDGVASARPIGLFTSLPIVWRESGDVAELLKSDASPHWALAAIRARGHVQPLDVLAGKDGKLPLTSGALLVLAQPRPLSPAENVALDDWAQAGGRVLLFADPMLTAHSAFPLGDKRRPQDIVMLSPILARWGLQLQFDDSQPPGEHTAELFGALMPVNLAGSFALGDPARCELHADGLAARCRVGAGEVLAIADAALFEDGTFGDGAERRVMFNRLLTLLAD